MITYEVVIHGVEQLSCDARPLDEQEETYSALIKMSAVQRDIPGMIYWIERLGGYLSDKFRSPIETLKFLEGLNA